MPLYLGFTGSIMSKQPKLTDYVSDIDKVFHGFDKKNPNLSKSQIAEIEKSRRVSYLRDVADRLDEKKKSGLDL
jgi:hypothetical protein